ncbi:peptide ABC transporter permease, partial [Methylobacterium radiotolerans]
MTATATVAAPGPARRAVLRFARERTAVAALTLLVLIALACLIGPGLTGHDPERAYPDLRQLPAGLTAQPDAARLRPALERLAFRMRARLDAVERDGDAMRLTLGSDAGLDR